MPIVGQSTLALASDLGFPGLFGLLGESDLNLLNFAEDIIEVLVVELFMEKPFFLLFLVCGFGQILDFLSELGQTATGGQLASPLVVHQDYRPSQQDQHQDKGDKGKVRNEFLHRDKVNGVT